jgi:hypothetical protein
MTEFHLVTAIGRRVRRFLHRLRRRFPRAISRTLLGGCAIGSTLFVAIARRCGLDAVLAYGKFFFSASHVWVVVRDAGRDLYLVDVTATQFGCRFPAVYVTDSEDDLYIECFRGTVALRKVNGWAKSEKPSRFQAPKLHQREMNAEVDAVFG